MQIAVETIIMSVRSLKTRSQQRKNVITLRRKDVSINRKHGQYKLCVDIYLWYCCIIFVQNYNAVFISFCVQYMFQNCHMI